MSHDLWKRNTFVLRAFPGASWHPRQPLAHTAPGLHDQGGPLNNVGMVQRPLALRKRSRTYQIGLEAARFSPRARP